MCADFLTAIDGPFEYIIGNPPYVPITELLTREKETFRRRFASAEGRFDSYRYSLNKRCACSAWGQIGICNTRKVSLREYGYAFQAYSREL